MAISPNDRNQQENEHGTTEPKTPAPAQNLAHLRRLGDHRLLAGNSRVGGSSIIGTWRTNGTQNGIPISFVLNLNSDGSASLTKYMMGNFSGSNSFDWSYNGSTICFTDQGGSTDCGNAYMTPLSLSITMGGRTIVYGRDLSQVPFTGRGACCKSDCSCGGWIGGGPNGNCARKGCSHSLVMHADASGCTYH